MHLLCFVSLGLSKLFPADHTLTDNVTEAFGMNERCDSVRFSLEPLA